MAENIHKENFEIFEAAMLQYEKHLDTHNCVQCLAQFKTMIAALNSYEMGKKAEILATQPKGEDSKDGDKIYKDLEGKENFDWQKAKAERQEKERQHEEASIRKPFAARATKSKNDW